jgi:uncharacterized protein YceH (UPF0502 family)
MNEEVAEDNTAELIQPQLEGIQARVLGVLMEKQQTTPDAYPLTLNSLVIGCNQKTSRDPVTNYTSGDIQHCLRELADNNLVHIDPSGRADRFAQRLTNELGIDRAKQALLNVMLLRGAQTVHELLTRTQRMHSFDTDQEVEDILDELCQQSPPMVQRIAKQTGQRDDRFVHLLCGEPDLTAIASKRSQTHASVSPQSNEQIEALEARITELEKKIEFLIAELDITMPQSDSN